jgi:uncharacterized protein (TIGR00725 family)
LSGADGGAGPLYVAVVGPGTDEGTDLAAAEAVGRLLAEAGAVLVCGGLGGAMAAACRGAREAGGLTVGILPGTDRAEANRWVVVAVPTGLGELRNGLVVRAADAVVAVGGGYGTLSEIALALRTGCPVVGLGSWRPPAPPGARSVVEASNPPEAVALVLQEARNRREV